MLQGSSSSSFNARVVHDSRLGVHVGLWARRLGSRGTRVSCRARGSEARGSWGSGFKARVVHASRLIEFEVQRSCGSWL
jgi:hypothetical protein